MSQEDILKLLNKKPRLCIREIADELDKNQFAISNRVYKMIKSNEIKVYKPTAEELIRIRKKYPNSVDKGLNKLKVFEANNDS